MKKVIFYSMFAAASILGFTACDGHEDDVIDTKDAEFEQIAKVFYENSLAPTYTKLAANTSTLVSSLKSFESNKTQTNLQKVCDAFLSARQEWELSEAFLFGAATDFGIDPHIDSWPLDENAFNKLMASPEMIEGLSDEEGDIYANDNLGNALLGFHGIEYILFEKGKAKDFSKITDDELSYAIAVAGDLRNHTYQLEVSWVGDDAPKAHVDACEELEYNTTVNGSDFSYGENLLNAGKAGSTFKSWTAAIQYIIQGSIDIADEVGSSKIGKPHSGEDITYIESPYSFNSIKDFYNNITSVANSYYGGREGNRIDSSSLHAWMKKNNPSLDAKIDAAITSALSDIDSMVFPFVENYKDASVARAIEACGDLVDALDEALQAVAQ